MQPALTSSLIASTEYPAPWQLSPMGASTPQGRPLKAWVAGNDTGNEVEPCPLMILGATHGDEPESHWLVAEWMTQWSAITKGIESKGVVVIPCLNPDGLALKTRQNANGVDLNRNFPTANWGQVADAAEKDPSHPYYGGPRAGSEPETQWLMQLLESHQPKAILSVHTPYKVVNWDGPPKTHSLAQVMSDVTGYPVTASIGYPTPGSFGTYVGIERHIPVITLELPEESPELLWTANQDVPQACLQWIQSNF